MQDDPGHLPPSPKIARKTHTYPTHVYATMGGMDRCDDFRCEAPATTRVRYDSVVDGPDASALACLLHLPDLTGLLDAAPDVTCWCIERLPALTAA